MFLRQDDPLHTICPAYNIVMNIAIQAHLRGSRPRQIPPPLLSLRSRPLQASNRPLTRKVMVIVLHVISVISGYRPEGPMLYGAFICCIQCMSCQQDIRWSIAKKPSPDRTAKPTSGLRNYGSNIGHLVYWNACYSGKASIYVLWSTGNQSSRAYYKALVKFLLQHAALYLRTFPACAHSISNPAIVGLYKREEDQSTGPSAKMIDSCTLRLQSSGREPSGQHSCSSVALFLTACFSVSSLLFIEQTYR